jgi:hypothetical protein
MVTPVKELIVSTDPYLGTTGSGIIIVICVVMRETQGMDIGVYLHIRT